MSLDRFDLPVSTTLLVSLAAVNICHRRQPLLLEDVLIDAPHPITSVRLSYLLEGKTNNYTFISVDNSNHDSGTGYNDTVFSAESIPRGMH